MLLHHRIEFCLGCEIARIRFIDGLLDLRDLPGLKINVASNRFSAQKRLRPMRRLCQLSQLILNLRGNPKSQNTSFHIVPAANVYIGIIAHHPLSGMKKARRSGLGQSVTLKAAEKWLRQYSSG
jgi:hypothetical protein